MYKWSVEIFYIIYTYYKHGLEANFRRNQAFVMRESKLLHGLHGLRIVVSNIPGLMGVRPQVIQLHLCCHRPFPILPVGAVKHAGLAPDQFQVLVPHTDLQCQSGLGFVIWMTATDILRTRFNISSPEMLCSYVGH